MYWGREVSYILYRPTYYFGQNFGRTPTVEKFNPQLIFHNSNTITVKETKHTKLLAYWYVQHLGWWYPDLC